LDKVLEDKVVAFEKRMSASHAELAREEIAADKRWSLLQAIAYLATGDDTLVQNVRLWCPPGNALPHHNSAQSAAIHLARELNQRGAVNQDILTFDHALRSLLDQLRLGSVMAYVNAKSALLTGLSFQELIFSGDNVGLSPTPKGDARYWSSVYVNATDIRRAWQMSSARTRNPSAASASVTGSKRGPKPKWDWLNLMGELVRIADQDGLDSLGGQADIERWAAAWLAERAGSDAGPAESLVREHIAPIFGAIEQHNRRKAR